MRLPLIAVLATALTLSASPAFAIGACKTYTTITPDTAAVDRTKIVKGGGNANLGGTAYTKAAFCPAAAAAGTCTGESLSEKVDSHILAYVTYDGAVPDIYQHRNGIYIGPVFIPLTPLLPDPCP